MSVRHNLQLAHCSLNVTHPQVMGILNITPDSFSDGGELFQSGKLHRDKLLRTAQRFVHEGATILDIGGESTRPGAHPPSLQEEMDRVLPALSLLRSELECLLSVDSSSAAVIRAAADLGADMVNDVRALRQPHALEAVSRSKMAVCLMHMRGEPRTMQGDVHYTQLIPEIRHFLMQRIDACVQAGISRDRILIDPGFGFGKGVSENLQIVQHLDELSIEGIPLMIGISRKSTIGNILGHPVTKRLAGTLALSVLAVLKGVAILRTHDVQETIDAVKMITATLSLQKETPRLCAQ